jgi:hypothetical protein
LLQKKTQDFVEMEAVAAFHHEFVVLFLYGCGNLVLGSSVLNFEWLLVLVLERLPLCWRGRGGIPVCCVALFGLYCCSCEVPMRQGCLTVLVANAGG